jgi:hypothetical protein
MTERGSFGEASRREQATDNRVSKSGALGKVGVAVVSLVVGGLLYALNAPAVDMLARELGGRRQELPPPSGTVEALWWDFVFIAGYGVALWLGTTVAGQIFWTQRGKRVARFGWGAGVAAVAADVVENALLIVGLQMEPDEALTRWVLDAAAAAATVKFSALVPATIVAVLGVVTTVRRSIPERKDAVKRALEADVRPPRPLQRLPAEGAGPDAPGVPTETSRRTRRDGGVPTMCRTGPRWTSLQTVS